MTSDPQRTMLTAPGRRTLLKDPRSAIGALHAHVRPGHAAGAWLVDLSRLTYRLTWSGEDQAPGLVLEAWDTLEANAPDAYIAAVTTSLEEP